MKRKAHPHEHEVELNIIPYLDIMVNLVMFMLMSMTGFITFQMVNVNTPAFSKGDGVPPQKTADELLTLNVSIAKTGFFIAATGGELPAVSKSRAVAQSGQPTIPLKEDGKYDYDALTAEMTAIKKQYPETSQFFLAADRDVKFDIIIQTMDATRGNGPHPLFPDVAFAAVM